jgi:hypothetical protein
MEGNECDLSEGNAWARCALCGNPALGRRLEWLLKIVAPPGRVTEMLVADFVLELIIYLKEMASGAIIYYGRRGGG